MSNTVLKSERYSPEENTIFNAILNANKDESKAHIAKLIKLELDSLFPNNQRTLKGIEQRIYVAFPNFKPKRPYVKKDPVVKVKNTIKPSPITINDINFGDSSKMVTVKVEISMDKLSKILSMYISQNV